MTDATVVIVPIRVDALMVNYAVAQDPFYQAPLDFKGDFTDPEPVPLIQPAFKFDKQGGMHLHWHLPRALGHGRIAADTGGRIRFPKVPNRWLVLRYHHPRDRAVTADPDAAGWLVHSDYLSDDDEEATSPVGPKLWMGRHIDLATTAWKESESTPPAQHGFDWPMTALGPGLPNFAAFQPYCRDVFSLHDPLAATGVKGAKPASLAAGRLSYLVVGWHAGSEHDVLHPAEIDAVLGFFGTPQAERHSGTALEVFGWRLAGGDTGTLTRSLYAGTVLAVDWDPDTKRPAPVAPGYPVDPGAVKIAVGHDAADATAALLEQNMPAKLDNLDQNQGFNPAAAADLLHAFQIGHLDTLERAATDAGVRELLDSLTHRLWFQPTPGGMQWRAHGPGDGHQTEPAKATRGALATLNQAQNTCDQAALAAVAQQRTVYELWWLSQTGKQHQVDKELTAAAQQLADLAKRLKDALAGRDKAKDEAVKVLPKDWSLKSVPRPPFNRAADPVILVRGAGTAGDTSRDVPCRTPDQLISSVTVKLGTEQPITAPAEPPVPAQWASVLATLPKELAPLPGRLAAELYVLHAAACLLTSGDTPLATDSRLVVKAPGALPALTGHWRQPWTPLMVQWLAKCYPLPYHMPDGSAESCWTFDGSGRHLRTDDAIQEALKKIEPYVLKGRSLLSDVPAATLARQVDAYQRTLPADSAAFASLRGETAKWDLACQTVTGLSALLIRRRPGVTLAEPPESLGLRRHAAEVPDPTLPFFQTVQAAHFALDRLVVMDTFGRAAEVVRDTGDKPNNLSYQPVRSRDMTPTCTVTDKFTYRYAELPPRLPQPIRLTMAPLSCTATTSEPATAMDPATRDRVVDTLADPLLRDDTPVCGWLIMRGNPAGQPRWRLGVYGPHGEPLGEIRRIGPDHDPKNTAEADRRAVTWQALPGSTLATPARLWETSFTGAFPGLAGFLHALVDADADAIAAGTTKATGKAGALADLAAAIDAALLNIGGANPATGNRVGAALAAGRPLALVRARVTLELDGPPRIDPAQPDKPGDPDHQTRRWPVRLGFAADLADGLIGYYTAPSSGSHPAGAADYSRLHAVHVPATTSSSYLAAIGTGAGLTVAARPAGPTVDADAAAYVTLLMDPFTAVHAHTGIHPVIDFRLPPAAVADVLDRLDLAVPLGPALARLIPPAPQPAGAAAALPVLDLPCPAAPGQWGWAEHARPSVTTPAGPWIHHALTTTDSDPRLELGTPDAHAGYLTYQSGTHQ
ncbi:hypothetical protein [Nonomuraea sp. NPDC001699]